MILFIINLTTKKNNDNKQIIFDAVSALENLGYRKSEIHKVVNQIVISSPNITLETLITESLRKIK